jgi:hypothetical protein
MGAPGVDTFNRLDASPANLSAHSPAPPRESDGGLPRQRWDDLRLTLVSGVGPLTRRALLAAFGTAGAVLDATIERLSAWPRPAR